MKVNELVALAHTAHERPKSKSSFNAPPPIALRPNFQNDGEKSSNYIPQTYLYSNVSFDLIHDQPSGVAHLVEFEYKRVGIILICTKPPGHSA